MKIQLPVSLNTCLQIRGESLLDGSAGHGFYNKVGNVIFFKLPSLGEASYIWQHLTGFLVLSQIRRWVFAKPKQKVIF